MARVSLILPMAPGVAVSPERFFPFLRELEGAGHQVDAIVVADPRASAADVAGVGDAARVVFAEHPGMAVATMVGLREAVGDILVVLDVARGYAPQGMARVVEALLRGEAEFAVACRDGARGLWGGPAGWSRTLARGFVGTSDPSSGLVAMTRRALPSDASPRSPVGSQFTLELLARAVGTRIDVPIEPTPILGWGRFELDDLRHLKRLADHRFGDASRLIQFCAVGASGMVIDLASYALFQWVFSRTSLAGTPVPWSGGSADLAAAGAASIALALVWNFSLNRRLTFNDARGGSVLRQFATYVLGNAVAIALSFSLRMILPVRVPFFGRHRLAAALVGIVAATGISFSMSRWIVFNRRPVGGLREEAASLSSEPSLCGE